MAQNLNQFNQTAVVGELDLQTNPNPASFTMKFHDESDTAATTLLPGEGVKLIDLGGSDTIGVLPLVDERAAVTDALFGVKIFSTKKNAAVSGEIVQIAGKGAVMFLNSGAAIARGDSVSLVIGTPGNVITNVSTGEILGIALDKAVGANEIIRVLIDIEGYAT